MKLLQKNGGEMMQNDQDAIVPDHDTRIEQAETWTEQPETRTEQAELRTEQAENSEQALRASELSYRRLFETAQDGILILDIDTGCVTDVNPFLLNLLGFPRSEMVGKTVGELSPFKDIWSNKLMLERLQKDGYVRYEDLPLQARDGRRIAVEFVSNVYQAGDKKVIQCNIRDITERKQAEKSSIQLAAIVESSDDAIIGKNLDGIIQSWNAGAEKIFGYSAGEMVGGPITPLIPAERLEEENHILEKIKHGESVRHFETVRQAKNGRRIDVAVTVSPIKDSTGKIVGASKVARDITERKRAEEELRWKTAFLEAQVDSAPDGILVVDGEGKQILQNQRMNELWKFPPHIAGNKNDADKLRFAADQTKHPQQFADKVAYLYSHPDEVSRDEIELIDGTVLDRYSSPVRDKAGKHYGRIWTFRDITERRKLEEQFRQSQKMDAIGQLAGGVAHDFNNILAVIQLQAGLLKTDGNLSPAQLDFAEEIGAAAQRAAALTRQLLLFSRKEILKPCDLDLNQSINDMTKMLRRTLGEDIRMQFKFAMQSLLIHADAGMMDQVLMNLAVNARDAMPKGGRLVIETSAVDFDESVRAQSAQARPGSFVCLSVSDTGCGIPLKILPRIFEPFFTTKDVGKGTGLGLATVFGIVGQHQGWIEVQSEVGHGTTFHIYLPRLAKMFQQKPEQPTLTSMRGGNETILLVEDDAFLRASVRKTLSQLGYRVLEAINSIEALEVWKQNRDGIHLLLTDLVMPGGMTGKDLGERLLKENPKLKVIYASGYSANVANVDFPLEEGVNFLTKPFQAQKLAQTVRQNLDANI
jgi:PAS domain S-box-containing protein